MLSLRSVYKAILTESEESQHPLSTKDIEEVEKQIIPQFKEKLIAKGIQVGDVLGSGTKGIAYSAGSQVLKITIDVNEVKAASVIKSKTLKNVYKVFDIFQFGTSKFYGIVQEKLKPIDYSASETLVESVLNSEYLDPLWHALAQGGVEVDDINKKIDELLGSFAHEKGSSEEDTNNARDMLTQIVNGVQELRGIGVHYADVHPGNVMKRMDGTIVLIDIGYSKVNSAGKVPVI